MKDMTFKLLIAVAVAGLIWTMSHVSGCHQVQPKDVDKAIHIVQEICDIAETVSDCTRKMKEQDAGSGGSK